MARITNRDITPILNAAFEWRDKCLTGDGSFFSQKRLWTLSNVENFNKYFVENLIYEGEETFYQKLEIQLKDAPLETKQLAAEMMWVILLFPRKISPQKKAIDIKKIWDLSGEPLEQIYPDLEKTFAVGVGSTGQAYNNLRWAELVFFTKWLLTFKSLNQEERTQLLSDPWVFGNWLDGIDGSEKRQFRHIVLFLLFPDSFETMSSKNNKDLILKSFESEIGDGSLKPNIISTDSDWIKKDKTILSIRNLLQSKDPSPVMFYESPYKERWLKDNKAEEDDIPDQEIYSKKFWLEKCDVKGRADRESGKYKLGDYLWSPQVSEDGKDIYVNMTKAKPGDVVFHLIDRNEISGISIVNDFADETFICLPGTKWAGQAGYAIPLKEYIPLDPSINRDEIFSYKNELLKILEDNKGLFYNKKLELNQGKYLTELPTELVQIFSKIYDKRAGKYLPHVLLDVPKTLIKESLSDMANEINDFMKGLFLAPSEFSEILNSFRNKKNLILQGPPGSGKSFVAKRLAYALLGSKDDSRIESIQFHQSYSYEDFMQGYRPKEEGEGFNLKNGVFYRFCKKASQDLTRSYVFIIDEINRGNLSKIFGEVMLLIESDKRGPEWGISLTYSNELSPKFHIPPNLFILGMMNTADRSLAMVDYALRRRFAFKDIEPGILTTQFSEYLHGMDVEASVVSKIQLKIGELNKKIETSNDLGAGFRIGHSFFVPNEKVLDSEVWYRSVIKNEIAPLLREYWFDKKKSEVDQEIEYLLVD